MRNIVLIGATGDVGRGIAEVLLGRGHSVIGVARSSDRLAALAASLGNPATLHTLVGSVQNDALAARLLRDIQSLGPQMDGVVVSVNAARTPAPLASYSSPALATLINQDLITHFTAARQFLPALPAGATYVGIGGGSCDFILHEGVPQSVAQAALRMLYRGLAHEFRDQPIELRELIIASVVNGVSTRTFADAAWVTDLEIGEQVAAILENPKAFAGPILRLARRDASGKPVFSTEPATRVQGFTQP